MVLRTVSHKFLAVGVAFAAIGGAYGQTLYAASGSNGVGGSLYTLDPTNGQIVTTVGLLRDAAGAAYGLTGLAFQPGTGVLYGATSNQSPTNPHSLVIVNPTTAVVTFVGSFAISGAISDLSFVSGGTLYGESSFTANLHTINLSTGAATQVGASGITGTPIGGGLSANSSNVMYSSPDAANLYTVNLSTGLMTLVGPHGLVAGHAVNAMQFNGSILYGLDTDRAATANVSLATINTTTGAITDLGLSNAPNLDALAFSSPVPEPATVCSLALGAVALIRRRKKS